MPFIETKLPCVSCTSSDGLAIDAEGRYYCFVCNDSGVYEKGPASQKPSKSLSKALSMLPATLPLLERYRRSESRSVPSRAIVKTTLDRFGVKEDKGTLFFPYYDEGGEVIAVKAKTPEKQFSTDGAFKESLPLFGMAQFSKGSGRAITIVEGELDALSVYQMAGNYPVVSIKSGAASALRDCQKAYEYLDSFDDIVICFDADEPGQAATKAVSELFAHKARIFEHVNGRKDANDYLTQGDEATFKKQWWAAKRYRPDGIITAGDLIDKIKVPLKTAPMSYPFTSLNRMTHGIRYSELVTFCAGSGLGKTTVLRELVDHLLVSSSDRIGLMFLEETPERTMRGLVGLALNRPIHLPDCDYDETDVDGAYETRQYAERVYFWDHFGSNDIDSVLSRMRYLVKVCEVRVIVLDHLSMLVSDQSAGDERKAIDEAMTKLRTFVQEVNIALFLVSHLRRPEGRSLEDGASTSLGMLRGSASIAQLSDIVIGAERNSQADDIRERNTTTLRVLKNRYSGQTGKACEVYYDVVTGRLTENL
jgi:twinkle protein